jgi:hypothetical protein
MRFQGWVIYCPARLENALGGDALKIFLRSLREPDFCIWLSELESL